MEEKAFSFFEKDPHAYADMKECVVRGRAEIVYAGEDGVLLIDKPSAICSFAANTKEAGERILKGFTPPNTARKFIVAHGDEAVAAVKSTFLVEGGTPCYQVVYEGGELPIDTTLTFKKADREEARIIEEYDRESPENLRMLVKAGQIWCAYEGEEFVGFIGRHPEGSMGLLLIFPPYRRKGYAYALEAKQINEILKEGRVPYAHIITDNDKSFALQQKLGFSVAEKLVTWMKIS